MPHTREEYVPKSDGPPPRGRIAAATLPLKRHREGNGRVTITSKIRYLASYEPSRPKPSRPIHALAVV